MKTLKALSIQATPLLILTLIVLNCAERPKQKIATTPVTPSKPETKEQIIMKSAEEGFFGTSLARYSFLQDPFKTECAPKTEHIKADCISAEPTTDNEGVKIFKITYDCPEIRGDQYYKVITVQGEKTKLLRIWSDELETQVKNKWVLRDQDLRATIDENKACSFSQTVKNKGHSYSISQGKMDWSKNSFSAEKLTVNFGNVKEKLDKAASRTLTMRNVALAWKTTCAHPPTGSANFEYKTPEMKEPLKGQIRADEKHVILPDNGGVQIEWITECKASSSGAPVGGNSTLEETIGPLSLDSPADHEN
jgi:hypothetical protein